MFGGGALFGSSAPSAEEEFKSGPARRNEAASTAESETQQPEKFCGGVFSWCPLGRKSAS